MIAPLSVAAVVLLLAILLTLAVGVRRRDAAAAVNALAALAIAVLPFVLAAVGDLVVAPTLALWPAAAGLLHAVGMLGPYDSVPWWDTVTHFVTASLVAAVCYAGALVGGVPWATVATILFTFAVGLWWELLELVARELGEAFDVEPVLVHYGRRDTLVDLLVDVFGAVAVVVVDVRAFVPVVERLLVPGPHLLRRSVVVVGGGFGVLALALVVLRWRRAG
jgi:hypothetical protein